METKGAISNFCNVSIIYDYNNIGFLEKLYQVRKFEINNFHGKKPVSNILVSLSIIDDVILKFIDNDLENVIEIVHDLREKIFLMLAFEKLVRDNDGKLMLGDKILSK